MPEDISIITAEKARTARVVGPYLQPLLQIAKASGVSPQELARAAGLPENALEPLPQWLLASNYIRLLDTGARLTQDEFFGLHVGAQVKLGTYNVYGLILLSCNDFAHALQQTMRYEGLAHDLGCSDLQVHGEIAEYQWHSYFPQASRHLTDSVFAGIAVFGSWLAGGTLPVREVGVCHAAPSHVPNWQDEYRRLLGIVPKFEQVKNYGLFDAELLERPVPNADVSMYPVLQQHAEQLLLEKQRSQQDGSIIAQVRATIVKNLAQDRVRLPMIAQDLNLTQRTLQRKLREANTSFQTVLDETRHELACNYLQQAHLNLAEIAFMLGFQEQSSFNHAFKEWQGINPGAYREQFSR
jgi:AraC-like DNA-binding protein